MEYLSRMITITVQNGSITPISPCRNVPVPTHLLYADDLILFMKGDKKGAVKIKQIFNQFAESSRLSINCDKSQIFFSKNFSLNRKKYLIDYLSFKEGSLPFNYLAAPLFWGKPLPSYF